MNPLVSPQTPGAAEADLGRTILFCSLQDLKKHGSITRWVDALRDELTAVYVGGEIYVRSSVCLHFGGELVAEPGQRQLRCKWHGWSYDLETGKCLTLDLRTSLRSYRHVVQGEEIRIVDDSGDEAADDAQ